MPKPKNKPQTCAEPGCVSTGVIRIEGNKALFCFTHKPVGRIAK